MAYALQILGDLDRARDVVQEVFLELCRAPRERVEGRLASWLFTVCRNRALDYRKKESRMSPSLDAAEQVDAPEASPEELAQSKERVVALMGAMKHLSDEEREAVHLKFKQGMSYREIAELMDITVAKVGFLLHRAMQSLRRSLRPQDPGLAR